MTTPAITLFDLSEGVARDLRDPDAKVLDAETLRDLINSAISDVNRVAPIEMQEDITPVVDTDEYETRITSARLLELWDVSVTPRKPAGRLIPASENPINYTSAGWSVWAGKLRLPYVTVANVIDPAIHLLRLWGWGPRLHLHELTDVAELTEDMSFAVREAAVAAGYERLMADRALFTQWQTLPGNTDVSPTQIGNMVSLWQGRWHERRRNIAVIRFKA